MQRMLLDAPSLTYRAFFALPKTLRDSDGQPVNAVRGVMDMITFLKERWAPDEIVAVFDADWRPAFRVSAFEGYKADRPEEPPELTPQFALLAEVLDAAGIPRAEAAGYEADDVIATLAAEAGGEDRVQIVTGDRDLLCLVRDPHVSLLFTVRGVRELHEFDESAVEERYGVAPRLYCEFAMLRGDNSDGLPGVPGVGPKTALSLLQRFGSIEAIYEHLDDLSARQREAFEASVEYLKAMEVVVPPATDVRVEATSPAAPQARRLNELGENHNLDGPVRRLWGVLTGEREER